ncbi:related to rna binding motif protein [Ustilago bromivora]|uniref:Related to rna binding motif protein n=1 Tax=Ustilago bromivora TaxID=307758 RepID=A0A1K0GVY7_9BASI|nr:related to rna binding motif protein [Ustilago bromivora]SYW80183.1 related to rna binding motif protein [Ustilago bromivora]
MNVVREITRINQAELDIALRNPSASWHAQYSDSAYIFIGGLPYDLTEGDVITIFSQYGEVVDVNLPRAQSQPSRSQGSGSKEEPKPEPEPKPVGKGKHRGFGFLMYQDQRSTVLAVDNLNGAVVLGRTLRVDHVAGYKQPKVKGQHGLLAEAESKSLNAMPQLIRHVEGTHTEREEQQRGLEDPMANYFRQRRKEERASIRAEREAKRRRREERGSSSRRYKDDKRQEKRHGSLRRQSSDQQEPLNRYQQIKKQPSILDHPESHTRDRRLSRRDRDRRHRDDDKDIERKHPSSHYHSSTGPRPSRSPA